MTELADRLIKEGAEAAKLMDDRAIYGDTGYALRYRFFAPETAKGKKYPLVVFLHGLGERGSDNKKQVECQYGAHAWASADIQKEDPCFIAAPQCPDTHSWADGCVSELVIKMIKELAHDHAIDTDRIYLTGLSMGGMGTWTIIAQHPELFAAAVPVCGAIRLEDAQKIKSMPIWAFHAHEDPVVPVAGSLIANGMPVRYGTRLAVYEAVRSGAENIKYTEYPDGYITEKYGHGHCSWLEVYSDPEVRKWLFEQNKGTRFDVTNIKPGLYEISDNRGGSFYVIEGADQSLVIDTGMNSGDINACIEKITRKPYFLALTHGHGDHCKHADSFTRIFMDFTDRDMLPMFLNDRMPALRKFVDISKGCDFDLGGGVMVKTVPLKGHTPGSIMFVDMFHKCVFTGDAVGSGMGVWMQVPGALKLSEYRENLKNAIKELRKLGVNETEWAFMGGHASQRFGSGCYDPISFELMEDMITLCDKLLKSEIEGKEVNGMFGPCLQATYDISSMLYNASQLY